MKENQTSKYWILSTKDTVKKFMNTPKSLICIAMLSAFHSLTGCGKKSEPDSKSSNHSEQMPREGSDKTSEVDQLTLFEQTVLGMSYYNGSDGKVQDFIEAEKWFRKSAEQGEHNAQHQLGLLYFEGKGVDYDYSESLKWFKKAAQTDSFPESKVMVGIAYDLGNGVDANLKLAYMWFNLAASVAKSEFKLRAENLRDDVAMRMSKEEISEAQKMSREWKPEE